MPSLPPRRAPKLRGILLNDRSLVTGLCGPTLVQHARDLFRR